MDVSIKTEFPGVYGSPRNTVGCVVNGNRVEFYLAGQFELAQVEVHCFIANGEGHFAGCVDGVKAGYQFCCPGPREQTPTEDAVSVAVGSSATLQVPRRALLAQEGSEERKASRERGRRSRLQVHDCVCGHVYS